MAAQPTRRDLLKTSTAGALVAIAAPSGIPAPNSTDDTTATILRPRPCELSGLHAYLSQQSVAPGDTLQVYASSPVPYRLSVVRLGPAIDHRDQDELVHLAPLQPPLVQPIRPGSCLIVEQGLPEKLLQADFAIEIWLRPFLLAEPQAVLTQASEHGPWGVFLTDQKELTYRVGEQTLLRSAPLPTLKWTHMVLCAGAGQLTLWINGTQQGGAVQTVAPKLLAQPLVIGGLQCEQQLIQLLDSDIAQPTCYQRRLTPEEIRQRFTANGLKLPDPDEAELLGCWPLDEERGDTVADLSSHRRTGRIVNGATWMIGGPSFDGRNVARFGNRYEPAKDSLRGHALRLASDDLYDCDWAVTYQYVLPHDVRPGLHCIRADFELDGQARVHFFTFLVRKPPSTPKAPLLVLCSSNTWTAYNSTPVLKNLEANQRWFSSTAGGVNVDPLAPAFSCYLNHRAGQPAYQFGLRMPWPVAGPNVLYSEPNMGYSHLMRGERFAHLWLEENGYDYDLVLDLDLHRNPSLLEGYQCVLINGHSEYWSSESYRGLDEYLCRGGHAILFSGNTMFWRVSFNDAGTIMECRKLDNRIGGMTHASVGELYHSQDGKRGSLMRESGLAAWQIVGLECDGWGGITAPEFGVYHTEAPEHFLFLGPEPVGLKAGETFGHAPDGGVPKAIGHEWDVRLSRLKGYTQKVPADFVWPEEPAGIVTLARGVRAQTHALDYFTEPVTAPDGTVAEMIYWERPQGGKVFHGGAIAVGWALTADPKLQKLVRNVLHHFGVKRRGHS
ncbi:MAG: N,N-dimethylformamidase beta subunit family domain-containing protein [Planctomycetota bacterium]